MERGPAERAAFLAQTCDGDEEIRWEVESLLAAHEGDSSFMNTPVGNLLAGDKPMLAAGQHFGPYEEISPLGEGGMGQVYLAVDTRLGRRVALKLLPSSYTGDADRVRRFGQEARAASALNHPNIVTIHEIGQADSLHFMATEFVDGETLREHMTNTRMTVGEVLDVATQIASALQAAHEAGIVHRDVKPENIMLRRDGFVKVLDFGLAKLIEGKEKQETGKAGEENPTIAISRRHHASPSVTLPGVVMGTVGYMSPEQARGTDVDTRTDVWSLGVVLYEMVAGRTPFEGETPSHVIVSILESEPPPLSLSVGVPAELERIISKALRKERAKRYETASDMALDLKNLKEELTVEFRLKQFRRSDAHDGETATNSDGPVALNTAHSSGGVTDVAIARLTSSAKYLISEVKRHKGGALFTSVTAFLLIASFLYFSNSTKRGGEAIDSVAVLPFVNARGDPETESLANGISDSIINNLSRLPNLKVISLSAALRYKGQQMDPQAVQAVGREFNVKAVLIGRLTLRGDDLVISTELVDVRDNRRLWGEQYSTKLSGILVVQREIAQQISSGLRLRLPGEEKKQIAKQHTENPDAYRAYLWGRSLHQKRTRQMTEKSIEYFEQAIKLDPDYALAYATLADAHISLAKSGVLLPDEALLKAKEAVTKALEIDDTLAEAHAALGSIRFLEWDWSGAERAFHRASELNPNYERNHSDYEHFLRAMKRYDEAVAESKRVLELEPVSAFHHRSVAMALYYARRYDEAIEQSHKALELDPNMPTAYRWLAKSYEQKKLYDLAVEAYLKTAEFTEYGPEAGEALREAYAASGWKSLWRKALALMKERTKIPGESSAEAYARLGENDQALASLEKAYEQRQFMIPTINRDPVWDGLRSDPRYIDIIRRMGLEP